MRKSQARNRSKKPVVPDDADAAQRSALWSLARRSLTRAEVIDRLTRRGYDAPTSTTVADRLTQVGVINDAAVARAVISTQLAQGKSSAAWLRNKLRARKVPTALAGELIKEAIDDRDTRADATRIAKKKARALSASLDPDVRHRRVLAALARLGFDPETARQATHNALNPTDEHHA